MLICIFTSLDWQISLEFQFRFWTQFQFSSSHSLEKDLISLESFPFSREVPEEGREKYLLANFLHRKSSFAFPVDGENIITE
jgi:hypothetical protein